MVELIEDLQDAIARYRDVVPRGRRRITGPPWDAETADAVVTAVVVGMRPNAVLPAEVDWFWRNHDPYDFELLPYPQLTDPEFALDSWRMEQAEGDEHPRALFPIAYESHGFLYVELNAEPDYPSPVWSFGYGDDEFVCRYPSVAALFRATADAVEASGIQPPADPSDLWDTYSSVLEPGNVDRYVDRYFDESLAAERRTMPYGDPQRWPYHWYATQGITEDETTVRGRTHTVAEFKAAAQTAMVAGRLQGTWKYRAGGDGGEIGILTDPTGAITLRIAEGLRVVGPPNGEKEIAVATTAPLNGRPDPLTELDPGTHFFGRDHLAAVDALHDQTLPIANRIVPLD